MIRDLIAEVEERNRHRREAGLPLLPVAKEVRKIYEAQQAAERAADFEHFARTSPLRAEIEDELLTQERLARNDPTWKPTGMLSGGGLWFRLLLRHRLRRHYPG